MSKGVKKVLFTSHTANFSKFNRPFMRLLKEQGYEVHYASMGEEEVKDCDKHFTIPFERSPFKLNNLRAIRQLKKIIDTENYDLIHTHTPMGSVVTRLAAKQARKRGTRVIYTAHGFHFFKGASIVNWLTYYPVERYMARHTDTLITINKEDYERAKKSFKTEVKYVPGVGIDEKKFNFKMTKAEKNKLRESLGLKPDDFVMIYPAELSKRKNQLWLISAVAKLITEDDQIHLLLPGQDSLNGECSSLARKLGVDRNVHFLGYRRDMQQLMKISNLAVSASLQEGLPVNIMEALSAKLPVIATNCRGNRDLINEYSGFLIERNATEQLQQSILKVRNDERVTQTLTDAGHLSIHKYLIENVLDDMASIYRGREL